MKKLFLILTTIIAFTACKKEYVEIQDEDVISSKPVVNTSIVTPIPSVITNQYLFDGTINGELFQTNDYTVSNGYITIGDGVPTIMIIIDTLYQGGYTGFNGFSGCISTYVNTNNQDIISWCNGYNPTTNYIGDLDITSLNDSIINGELSMVLFNDKFKDSFGNFKDSTLIIKGMINGLNLK